MWPTPTHCLQITLLCWTTLSLSLSIASCVSTTDWTWKSVFSGTSCKLLNHGTHDCPLPADHSSLLELSVRPCQSLPVPLHNTLHARERPPPYSPEHFCSTGPTPAHRLYTTHLCWTTLSLSLSIAVRASIPDSAFGSAFSAALPFSLVQHVASYYPLPSDDSSLLGHPLPVHVNHCP